MERDRERERLTGRQTKRQTDREKEKQRDRGRERDRERDRERLTDRQTDKETDRQRDRQTKRQTDREEEKQRDRGRERANKQNCTQSQIAQLVYFKCYVCLIKCHPKEPLKVNFKKNTTDYWSFFHFQMSSKYPFRKVHWKKCIEGGHNPRKSDIKNNHTCFVL